MKNPIVILQIATLLAISKKAKYFTDDFEVRLLKKSEDDPNYFEFFFQNIIALCQEDPDDKSMYIALDSMMTSSSIVESNEKFKKGLVDKIEKEKADYQTDVLMVETLSKQDKLQKLMEMLTAKQVVKSDTFDRLVDIADGDVDYFNRAYINLFYVSKDKNIDMGLALESILSSKNMKEACQYVRNHLNINA